MFCCAQTGESPLSSYLFILSLVTLSRGRVGWLPYGGMKSYRLELRIGLSCAAHISFRPTLRALLSKLRITNLRRVIVKSNVKECTICSSQMLYPRCSSSFGRASCQKKAQQDVVHHDECAGLFGPLTREEILRMGPLLREKDEPIMSVSQEIAALKEGLHPSEGSTASAHFRYCCGSSRCQRAPSVFHWADCAIQQCAVEGARTPLRRTF